MGGRISGFARLAGAVAAFAVIGSLGGCGGGGGEAAGPEPFWPDQGWTPEVRRAYHHQSQGTATLPIPSTWFLALERPVGAGDGLFSDPDYLEQFGFIRSARDAANPDGLPIGFTRTVADDPRNPGRPRIDRIGFTCAACHTGRIDYGETSILVDGGPALINLGEFRKQLGEALKKALVPTVFRRFANRVLGDDHTRAQRETLRRALVKVVVLGLIALIETPRVGAVEEGFGRLDALNRIGNQVFGVGMGIHQNIEPITAPVAFPHIWDAPWFDWVQYNASIRQPMVRNAGEAMGVGGLVNYGGGPGPLFTSTIPIGALHDNIEQPLAGHPQPTAERRFAGLRAPAWPEQILGRIDRPLAERGAALYRDRCRGCHLPATNTAEFWEGRHWLAPNQAGERYLRLNLIPISTVGTDPAQAEDMRRRTVLVPASLGLPRGTGTGTLRTHGFADALKELVERVANRWYDSHVPPIVGTQRDNYNGNRPNEIDDQLAYKARPLDGIWATGPFLHNGSVPTLWDLLSPYPERNRHCAPARRDRCILLLGNREFDPAHVGYASGGSFRLNTALRGNYNTGHLFQNRDPANPTAGIIGPALSPDERRALIEYLKTL
jgi:hypothetical protein